MKEMTAKRLIGWLNAYAEYENTAGNDTTAEHAQHIAERLEHRLEGGSDE